jgi:hypothetical protein
VSRAEVLTGFVPRGRFSPGLTSPGTPNPESRVLRSETADSDVISLGTRRVVWQADDARAVPACRRLPPAGN